MAIFSPTGRTVAALAFDLDDTLFDRDQALRRLLEGWKGAALDEEEWADVRAADGGGQSPRRAFFHELALRFPAAGKNGLAISRRFRHELPARIAPDAAVVKTLANLRSLGLPMAILSNGSSSFQKAKLRACGAAPFFAKDQVLISGALGFSKPDPRAFAALATRLGVQARGILFIGNDPERDIAGALGAGMQACLVRVGDFPHLLDLSYFTTALPT